MYFVEITIRSVVSCDTSNKHSNNGNCLSRLSNALSLLHYAAISGWESTIALLLDHGADPRQTCMTGETALHFAVSLKHGEAAEMMLKRCRDLVNEADKVGLSREEVCKYRI